MTRSSTELARWQFNTIFVFAVFGIIVFFSSLVVHLYTNAAKSNLELKYLERKFELVDTSTSTLANHISTGEIGTQTDVQLFENFLLWLQVIMAVTFGVIAYLQWRDAQRYAKQQEIFTNYETRQQELFGSYVDSSTRFMGNSADLINSLKTVFDFQKEVKDDLLEFKTFIQKREEEVQDMRNSINEWARGFVAHWHRHQSRFAERLKDEFLKNKNNADRLGIDMKTLSADYIFIAGQYAERIATKATDAIDRYSEALRMYDGQTVHSKAMQAAVYRNRGLAYLYTNRLQQAVSDFESASNVYGDGRDLNSRFRLTAELLRLRQLRFEGHEYGMDEDSWAKLKERFHLLLSKEYSAVDCKPMDIDEYLSQVRVWYAGMLLFDFNCLDYEDEIKELLFDVPHEEGNHQLDWMRFRASLTFGLSHYHSRQVLRSNISICSRALSRIVNNSERINLYIKKSVYQAYSDNKDMFSDSLAEAAGLLDVELAARDQDTLFVYSVFEERYVSLERLKDKLENVDIGVVKAHFSTPRQTLLS